MTLEATHSPTIDGPGGPADSPPAILHGEAALVGVPMLRVNAAQGFFRGFIPTVVDIWRYRELLTSLVRKELKVKYKGSILGFLWSFLRPLFLLLIYFIAIGKFLRSPIPDFVVFMFSGLVVWTLFTDVANGATTSIVGNAGLIKKVYFPREILPLAVVGAALVQFVLMLVVLMGAVLISGRSLAVAPLLLLPVSFLGLLLFMTAVGLLLAAANVYLRDTQHLIEVVLLFWFWMTPVVYAVGIVEAKIGHLSHLLLAVYLANPIGIVAMGFQRAVYQQVNVKINGVTQPLLYSGNIWARELILIAASAAFLWIAQRIFARAQGSFAQEL